MYLIIDQMRKLNHVNLANGNVLIEFIAGAAVVKLGSCFRVKIGMTEISLNVLPMRSIENRSLETNAELPCGKTKRGLVKLTDIHTARNAKRIEHNIYRSSIC